MSYKNIAGRFFGLVTKHMCDKTDRQNYDSQDHASIAGSRGKKLDDWKDNVKNKGMRVNMNKTKVMISEKVKSQCRRLQDGLVVYVAEVLVVIQYSVLVVRSGYTRSVVV